MKKNTKITSFVLVMLLILQVILPVATNLEIQTSNATTEEQVTYSYSGTTLTITGSGAITESWKHTSELANYVTTVKTVIINSNEITEIGNNAFSGCIALNNINSNGNSNTLPESLETIGNNAFSNCTSLTTLTYKGNLTKLGDSAFSGCTSLTEFTDGTEGGMAHLKEKISVIGKDVFAETKIENIRILNKQAEISKQAFSRKKYPLFFRFNGRSNSKGIWK